MSRARLLLRWLYDQFIYPVFAGLCSHEGTDAAEEKPAGPPRR